MIYEYDGIRIRAKARARVVILMGQPPPLLSRARYIIMGIKSSVADPDPFHFRLLDPAL
mgnify:FL=1